MTDEPLSVVLEREHHEIDSGITAFIKSLDDGEAQTEPFVAVLDVLRRHIYLEEVFVFPPIKAAGVVMPILVMLHEHGELWRTLDTLTELLDAGADRRQLADTCRQLLDLLDQHNAKEEPIIYPHADTDLPPDTSAELVRFIQEGVTPEGWVCQQAAGR